MVLHTRSFLAISTRLQPPRLIGTSPAPGLPSAQSMGLLKTALSNRVQANSRGPVRKRLNAKQRAEQYKGPTQPRGRGCGTCNTKRKNKTHRHSKPQAGHNTARNAKQKSPKPNQHLQFTYLPPPRRAHLNVEEVGNFCIAQVGGEGLDRELDNRRCAHEDDPTKGQAQKQQEARRDGPVG